MNENNTLYRFIGLHIMFFLEVSIGIIANTVLLLFRVLKFFLEHRLKSTNLITGHLALIHIMMLLVFSFIARDMFGFKNLGGVITCKSIIYLHRLMRGLSISTTCLLSVLQAITLSPRSSCLAKFKYRSSHHSLFCFLFLWIFNMFISSRFLFVTGITANVTSHNLMFLTESCSLWPISYLFKDLYFSLTTIRDIFCIGLMVLSSGYMVILLFMHKKQSRNLHSTSLSSKASPEQRATWTILLLMSFFTVMYFFDYAIASISGMLWKSDPIRHCIQMLVGNGYATVSPLVLVSTEKQIITFLISIWKKDNRCLIIK
ncbi:vomeronasal 1 receptor cavPorV1R611 [Cavia porcellus]|uniref:vomeronasal 1 receptor cavPorV1R611 n=1 Tax=Cavia porcellus TaxID=10141 RepID=UPI0001CF7400|nr:vomeronasal 1 receptor cavPorV1R611 [Cavia porcellus]